MEYKNKRELIRWLGQKSDGSRSRLQKQKCKYAQNGRQRQRERQNENGEQKSWMYEAKINGN